MTTPRKKNTARKKPARKKAAAGRPSLITDGFRWTNNPTDGDPPASWARGSHPARVLDALLVGATWTLAASYARVHERTPTAWFDRGRELLADHPDLLSFADTDDDREHRAYVAFYIAAESARADPVVGALDQIDRARRGGDWKAGAHLLKVLPQAKPFRPDPRVEVTGPDGGAIPVSVRDEAKAKLTQMADRMADAAAPAEDPEGNDDA